MPLAKPEDFGTDARGFRVADYCHFCYVHGAFVNPAMSMQEMIDLCVGVMAKQGLMPQAEARTLLTQVIPKLKRWRTPVASAVAGGR
jgi:hypothetical protein